MNKKPKQNDPLPLLYKTWLIAAGAVFGIAMAAQLFFSRTNYGFLYNGALLFLCAASFVVLMVGLCLWLCRHILGRKALKSLARAACALLCAAAVFLWVAAITVSSTAGRTSTGAGSVSGNPYTVHAAPEGRRRVLVLTAGRAGDVFVYPMLGPLLYREVRGGYIPEGLSEGYEVVWLSPQRAIVDGRIVVDFNRLGR